MMNGMAGMEGMGWGMGLIGLLVLGIAALVKYLMRNLVKARTSSPPPSSIRRSCRPAGFWSGWGPR